MNLISSSYNNNELYHEREREKERERRTIANRIKFLTESPNASAKCGICEERNVRVCQAIYDGSFPTLSFIALRWSARGGCFFII